MFICPSVNSNYLESSKLEQNHFETIANSMFLIIQDQSTCSVNFDFFSSFPVGDPALSDATLLPSNLSHHARNLLTFSPEV